MTNQNFMKKRFHTVDGDTIMNKQMPPLQYAIAEILPAGLTLFSGDSKVGKSMMALNMCVAVSKGEDFLGFPTTRGTVLYLALEDTESRIQRRVFSMTDTLGDTFHFTNEVYKIGDGLIEALEYFVKEHSDTRLIVIDVLQYIRSQSQGGNVYKEDYNDMIPLHEFTQRHSGIALVLINHTNKSNSGDQFKASSGSTAIVGASDNYWLLQRPVRAFRNGRLYCSGREISDREIALQMNDDGMWVCEDEEVYKGEIISPTVIGTYLYVMWHTNLNQIDKDTGEVKEQYACTATTLSEALSKELDIKIPPNMIKKHLTLYHHQLENMGLKFEYKRTGKQRLFIFSHHIPGLRRSIQKKDALPTYPAEFVPMNEDDDDSMTPKEGVICGCHCIDVSMLPKDIGTEETTDNDLNKNIDSVQDKAEEQNNDTPNGDDGYTPIPM